MFLFPPPFKSFTLDFDFSKNVRVFFFFSKEYTITFPRYTAVQAKQNYLDKGFRLF